MKDRKTERFQMRLTEEELTRLQCLAFCSGLECSEWIRSVINSQYVTAIECLKNVVANDAATADKADRIDEGIQTMRNLAKEAFGR